jgi:hypothetical protein
MQTEEIIEALKELSEDELKRGDGGGQPNTGSETDPG